MEVTTTVDEMLKSMPLMAFRYIHDTQDIELDYVSEGCLELTGYGADEFVCGERLKFSDIIHSNDDIPLQTLRTQTIGIGLPLEAIYRIITKSGQEKWVLEHSKLLETDDAGMPYIIGGFCTDLSTSFQSRVDRTSNRSKTDFLSKVGHEIRTPMNTIQGMAELILREDMLINIHDYTHAIIDAGKDLMAVLEDFFDFTKIKNGNLEVSNEDYTLSSIIDAVTANILKELTDLPLKFELDIDEKLPDALNGDSKKLRHVIQNILSNAVRFTQEGYITLTMSGEISDDILNLRISVSDTGRGIKEENINAVFDEFTQFETKSNREIGGTGLGLAIAKSLIELIGGEISASSQYGVGSVFTVIVPQQIRSSEPIGAAFDSKPMSSDVLLSKDDFCENSESIFTAPNAKILVVDDFPTNLMVTHGLLQPYNSAIDICSNGADAIESVKTTEYDLIFMDYLMPKMSGIEAVQVIRGSVSSKSKTDVKNVPIIALTASVDAGTADRFLDTGFTDILAKPIDSHKLGAMVRKYIPQEKQIAVSKQTAGNNSDIKQLLKVGKINIRGVDVEKGIHMVGGNFNYYLRVLKSFYDEGIVAADKINECVGNGDLVQYEMLVHMLKSAAGTIGADSLMNYARELEGAAKEKNLNLIQSKSGDFCKKLTALLHEIKPFTSTELGSNSAASPLPDDSKMKAGRQSNKQKIVIIDDTVSVLKLMQDALKDDYDVLTNKDARKALEIINKATPDLIILDLIMPDISGFDVLKQLKSSEVTGSIPVVIASGRDNDDEIAKCYDLGAVDVIRKPFVLSVFKRRIDFNMQFVSMKNKLSLEQSSDFL